MAVPEKMRGRVNQRLGSLEQIDGVRPALLAHRRESFGRGRTSSRAFLIALRERRPDRAYRRQDSDGERIRRYAQSPPHPLVLGATGSIL
jgi:hypothetical protein